MRDKRDIREPSRDQKRSKQAKQLSITRRQQRTLKRKAQQHA